MNSRISHFALLALTGVLVSCSEKDKPLEEVVRPVKATQIGVPSNKDWAKFSGKAKATREINVAFEVSGRIVELKVQVGDRIEKGQELASLDPRDYANAVEIAAAEVERSKAQFERIERAFESKAVSAQDVTNARAQASAAAAAHKIALKQLEDTTIRAPFTGRIAATYVENFENVLAKQKVARLINLSQVEMTVDLPERLIPNVPYVDSIEVVFAPFPDTKLNATVKEVGSEASQLTRTYPVTLIMDQPKDVTILPGMAGEAVGSASLPPERLAAGITIPTSAVVATEEGESFVWIIDPESNKVSRQVVTVDRLSQYGLVVTDGLKPQQWVVTAGANSLREGQKVRIFEQP